MTTAVETPVQTQPATEVTDDLLRELKEGKKNMDGLDKGLRMKVLEKLDSLDAEPETEKPVVEEKEPEKAKVEPKIEEVLPSAEESKKRIEAARSEQKRLADEANKAEQRAKAAKRLADEANKAEQRAKAAKERRDKAKTELEKASKVEVKLPEELLSEPSQSALHKELAELKSKQAAFEKLLLEDRDTEVTTSEETHRKISESSKFMEIDEVQAEFPTLQMSEPFEVANEKYAKWLTDIQTSSGLKEKHPDMDAGTLRVKAVEMWNADPEFRKKIANQPPKDNDKLMVLLKAYNEKQQKGGDLMGILLADFKRRGVLDEMVQRTAQKTAVESVEKTLKALEKDPINPIAPGEGGGRGYLQPDGLTREKAVSIIQSTQSLQARGGRLTPALKEQLQQAMAFLAGGE